jgi:uncharacterized protein HemX
VRFTSGDIGVLVAVLAFLFGIAGMVGSWRTSRNTGAITRYRESAQAWESYAKARDAEIADLRAESNTRIGELEAGAKAKDTQIAELQGKVAVLQEALTGRVSWEILEAKIGEALALIGEGRTEMRQMHEEIRVLAGRAA